MTALLMLVCDGHVDGQPCTSWWDGRLIELGGALAAALVAREAGWTTDGQQHQCPAVQHDERSPTVITDPNAVLPRRDAGEQHTSAVPARAAAQVGPASGAQRAISPVPGPTPHPVTEQRPRAAQPVDHDEQEGAHR